LTISNFAQTLATFALKTFWGATSRKDNYSSMDILLALLELKNRSLHVPLMRNSFTDNIAKFSRFLCHLIARGE